MDGSKAVLPSRARPKAGQAKKSSSLFLIAIAKHKYFTDASTLARVFLKVYFRIKIKAFVIESVLAKQSALLLYVSHANHRLCRRL